MVKWKSISQKLKKLYIILPLLGMGVFFSCANDDFEYEKKHQCAFTFDCGIHQGTVLQNCLNPMSPGLFCMVWSSSLNHIQMQLYNRQTEDVAITTANETRRACILGAGNGLVIGCSTLNNGQLYAFDRTCPNCEKTGLLKALQWENSGLWLKCPQCERAYDLNNNGFIVKGEGGDKLMRYRASYDGKVLFISN